MSPLVSLFNQEPLSEAAKTLLGEHGLQGTRTVAKNLRAIVSALPSSVDPENFLASVLKNVKETADPGQALNQLERFLQNIDSPEEVFSLLVENQTSLRHLSILFGASPYLSGILIQNPHLLCWLMQEQIWKAPPDRESLVRELLAACRGIQDIAAAYPILRNVKKREMLRIGARDLTGFADLTETIDALSILAEATLEASYGVADRFLKLRYGTPMMTDDSGATQECPFTVLGMGKLGGEELNFSSDVDLLYLYESDWGETTGVTDATGQVRGRVDNHVYFVRLSEMITDLMHASTEDGFVFRVDLRLRPEGAQGPVASSLRSYELYYESFGQTWERAAHLKHRPVAGDMALGREFEKLLTPFVYRKYFDYTAIDELREMKRRIVRQLVTKPGRGFNVKLGEGGIREIEFFVQTLQLLYGGRLTWIRQKNTLRALHRLCDKELITYDDFSALFAAYTFLRDVEHKLQIENQLQLQTLPTEPAKLDGLARRCGFPTRTVFLEELDRHRHKVQERFDNLLHEKAEPLSGNDSPVAAVVRGTLEEAESYQQLTALGFCDARLAHKNLQLLREGPPYAHSSSRSRALFLTIGPTLLEALGTSPDPDMALNNLERFVSGYGAREPFYAMLGANPEAMQRVVSLFSTSSYLSHLLIRHPDYIDVLFGEALTEPTPERSRLLHNLTARLEQKTTASSRLDTIRRFKHREEMKIGFRDILTNAELRETSLALSRLAEVCLEAAYVLALAELQAEFGSPAISGTSPGIAILGAGKLGSEELSYGSDLDLLFVYAGDGETSGATSISNRDFFARLAGRVVAVLTALTAEGLAYRVDLRLRPLGESGPLVPSLDSYRSYFERNLQPWERQAMTRCRFCAGHRETGRALLALLEETLFGAAPPPDLREQVFEMRMRIEREKSQRADGQLYFKTGAGGLVDIEFIVQYLQLQRGHDTPALRWCSPLETLALAEQKGLLSEADRAALEEAYLFLRRLESRARIVQDRPITSLFSDADKNRALALRMGYPADADRPPGQQLLDDYQAMTERTRQIFLRLLGPSA